MAESKITFKEDGTWSTTGDVEDLDINRAPAVASEEKGPPAKPKTTRRTRTTTRKSAASKVGTFDISALKASVASQSKPAPKPANTGDTAAPKTRKRTTTKRKAATVTEPPKDTETVATAESANKSPVVSKPTSAAKTAEAEVTSKVIPPVVPDSSPDSSPDAAVPDSVSAIELGPTVVQEPVGVQESAGNSATEEAASPVLEEKENSANEGEDSQEEPPKSETNPDVMRADDRESSDESSRDSVVQNTDASTPTLSLGEVKGAATGDTTLKSNPVPTTASISELKFASVSDSSKFEKSPVSDTASTSADTSVPKLNFDAGVSKGVADAPAKVVFQESRESSHALSKGSFDIVDLASFTELADANISFLSDWIGKCVKKKYSAPAAIIESSVVPSLRFYIMLASGRNALSIVLGYGDSVTCAKYDIQRSTLEDVHSEIRADGSFICNLDGRALVEYSYRLRKAIKV